MQNFSQFRRNDAPAFPINFFLQFMYGDHDFNGPMGCISLFANS